MNINLDNMEKFQNVFMKASLTFVKIMLYTPIIAVFNCDGWRQDCMVAVRQLSIFSNNNIYLLLGFLSIVF